MSVLNKSIIASVLIALYCSAFSIGSVTGKITKIRVDAGGKAMIFFDKPIGGAVPSCVHSAYKSVLSIDASTEGGKAVLAMVMAAKIANRTVRAHGFGRCSVYGSSNTEDWNHGFLL